MPIYRKESLEQLRQRIDLVDVLSSHLDLKRTGASYKACCPFHDENTPSFVVQKGDTHYHCYGCGAHGDAIQFLITHQRLTFSEAVESLAHKFQVVLEHEEPGAQRGQEGQRKAMREALEVATLFYHCYLLHTEEGHQALAYLYQRGLDLNFIYHFSIGLAPKQPGLFRRFMEKRGFKEELLIEAGLLARTADGRIREFFNERILFPIQHAIGYVIGYSGRKYREETFGGKYVNTTETLLFKKSRVLFGLPFSRKRIAKERQAIVVEGQIDALRLIQAGLNLTVAGQGTAFGEGHISELVALGIQKVYLALDGDEAGQEATCKIGDLFLKRGVEVRVVQLPVGSDPDSFLRYRGVDALTQLLHKSVDYLTFLVRRRSQGVDLNSPAAKQQLVQELSGQIRAWDQPLIVHESLKRLAQQLQLPEQMVGMTQQAPSLFIKRFAAAGAHQVDPDRVLELDFLRWLLLCGSEKPHFIPLAQANISVLQLKLEPCRQIYQTILSLTAARASSDLLNIVIESESEETQELLSELLQKRINREKAEEYFKQTIQKLLEREWMGQREVLRLKIQSGQCTDDEVLALVKEFDQLKQAPPILT